MQIKVKSGVPKSRPPREYQIGGPGYLDEIDRTLSSFDFAFNFPHWSPQT